MVEMSSQLLVKNTFIQLPQDQAGIRLVTARRPRTESCDAVLEGGSHYDEPAVMTIEPTIYEMSSPRSTSTSHTGDFIVDGMSRNMQDPSSFHFLQSVTDFDSSDQLQGQALLDVEKESTGPTTVMLRNIPNKYSQKMLLEVVNEEFLGLYDFFYLPIDFRNKCNVGYAFINFIHPNFASLFKEKFHRLKLSAFKSNKICEVSWGRVQGLQANIEHYKNSAVMSVPFPQYKPLIFLNGLSVPFPDADKLVAMKPRGQE